MVSRLTWLLLGLFILVTLALVQGNEEEEEGIQEAVKARVVRREAGRGGGNEKNNRNGGSRRRRRKQVRRGGGRKKNVDKKKLKDKNKPKNPSQGRKSTRRNNTRKRNKNKVTEKAKKKCNKKREKAGKCRSKVRNRQGRRKHQKKKTVNTGEINKKRRNRRRKKQLKKFSKPSKKKETEKKKKEYKRGRGRGRKKNSKKVDNDKDKKDQKRRRAKIDRRRKKAKRPTKPPKISRSGRTVTGNCTKCVELLLSYSLLSAKKATNIERQVLRIRGNDKVQGSKKEKKGDFNATYDRLLAALGGNATEPKCDGKPFDKPASTNKTRSSNVTAQDNLNTLAKCTSQIEKTCGSPLTGDTTINATLTKCYDLAVAFKKSFTECLKKTPDEGCKCVEAISTTDVADLKKCDTSKENAKALDLKKKCKKAVGTCKTAQGNSVEGIDVCKERTKCGGAKDKEEGKKILKKLAPLQKALQNPAFFNALKAVGLDTGPGADGILPSTGRQTHRIHKREDGAGCKEVDAEWFKFNQTASKALPDANADLDDKAANDTTAILDGINGRKSLTDDLKSCTKETTRDLKGRQVTVSFTIIRIRFYVFWCDFFRDFVVEVKVTIITSTFGLTNPNPTTPGTGVSTSAPSGRQNLLSHMRLRAALGKL